MFISHEKGTPQDNYELQKALGEGAYGTVIKAIHKLTKDVRAIKKTAEAVFFIHQITEVPMSFALSLFSPSAAMTFSSHLLTSKQ